MGEIDNTLINKRLAETQARADAAERALKAHGGDGGGEDMEARVAKVEAAVEHIQLTLTDIKTDIREMRGGFIAVATDFRDFSEWDDPRI